MRTFAVTIRMRGNAETVWAVLTDSSTWIAWNTTISTIEGRIAQGEKVVVYAKANPNRPFPITVTEFVPYRRMVWSGGLPLGLFKGTRTYTLMEVGDYVEFRMHEVFSGPLAPLFGKMIPDLQPSFDEFAAALKKRVESNA